MPFALNAERYTRGTIRSFLYLPPSWPFDGIRRHGPLTVSAVMAL
jgi:hypothetical protein